MSDLARRSGRVALLVAALALLTGCSTAPVTTGAPVKSAPATTTAPSTTPAETTETTTPAPSGGFAFPSADVVAYYESLGYLCAEAHSSSQAFGWTVRACQLTDDAGRTLVVGIVTDSAGNLGNGYAGVWAAAGETYLDPDIALDPLAAFLGTMLGEQPGADAAVWLKEHLGMAYEQTAAGELTVATYTGTDDDPTQLYVEVANQAYLDASPVPIR